MATASSSPNSLQTPRPPRPGKTGLSKKPMYIVLGIFFFILISLAFIMDSSDEKKKQVSEESVHTGRELLEGRGAGIALPPPPESRTIVVEPKVVEKPVIKEVPIKKPEDDSFRKRKELLYMNALSSELVKDTKNNRQQKAADGGSPAAKRSGTDEIKDFLAAQNAPRDAVAGTNYDPAAAIDREKFFDRADTTAGWLHRHTREAGRILEIKTGTVIPAVMVGGINSDLPGVMIAQISQNVYNSSNGKYLLIPQGAKLFGTYDSRIAYGQSRVLVAWNRIVYPDGSSVTLGTMPGADMSGYAGFHDQVNNHYFRIFGSAFLMSAIIGTTAYTIDKMDDDENGNYYSDKPDLKREMVTALAQQMSTTAMQMIQRNMNIAPTIEIRPGYQFNVMVTKDVAFAEPYQDYYMP